MQESSGVVHPQFIAGSIPSPKEEGGLDYVPIGKMPKSLQEAGCGGVPTKAQHIKRN